VQNCFKRKIFIKNGNSLIVMYVNNQDRCAVCISSGAAVAWSPFEGLFQTFIFHLVEADVL
jgi:hypothetical protein